jgi:thiamine kinase-like enzyme
VQVARYQVLSELGITPHILASGYLEDGISIIVQPYIAGKTPTPKDFQNHLEAFAAVLNQTHHSLEAKQTLVQAPSELYKEAGLRVFETVSKKWVAYKPLVPALSDFVDESLASLRSQILTFQGAGLAASHNDICNANWLLAEDGAVYLIDLESMAPDDPAFDLGALLWWYYPPDLRDKFITLAGYQNDEAFQKRRQVRMALHCLNIILPREDSFDEFDPAAFEEDLIDFRACFADQENPQGY